MALNIEKSTQTESEYIEKEVNIQFLKLKLTPWQLKRSKKVFSAIQEVFHQNGLTLTKDDTRLIDLIKIKILDVYLAENFNGTNSH